MLRKARTKATARAVVTADVAQKAGISGPIGPAGSAGSALMRLFVGGDLFTPEQTQGIIERTCNAMQMPAGGGPRSPPFRDLQQSLASAVQGLTSVPGPSRRASIAYFGKVAKAARHLHELITAEGDERQIWAYALSHAHGEEISTARELFRPNREVEYYGRIEAEPFARTIDFVARMARRHCLAFESSTREPFNSFVITVGGKTRTVFVHDGDLTVFVADLADAYSSFFGSEAGYSTESDDKRGGPFIRFAQAVGETIGLSLTGNQIKKRLSPWKKARMQERQDRRRKSPNIGRR